MSAVISLRLESYAFSVEPTGLTLSLFFPYSLSPLGVIYIIARVLSFVNSFFEKFFNNFDFSHKPAFSAVFGFHSAKNA